MLRPSYSVQINVAVAVLTGNVRELPGTSCPRYCGASMRVLIAFDKFKGALTAEQACAVVADVLRLAHPDWELDPCPLTDGGDGFAEILTRACGGVVRDAPVEAVGGGSVVAKFGLTTLGSIRAGARAMLDVPSLSATTPVGIVEMAQASGLSLLPPASRDPRWVDTRGTGQLIRAAMAAGADCVILGVGGSGTHDLGLGALTQLGLHLWAADGVALPSASPGYWRRIQRMTGAPGAGLVPIRIACDVSNPLLGPTGATATYGGQKGLRAEDQPWLESETARVSALLGAHCGAPASLRDVPGAGAAGGIAFGLMCAAGARLVSGFALVSESVGLDARLRAADVVVTGEGRFDATSMTGKAAGEVVRRATQLGKPVHVLAGQVAFGDRIPGLLFHPVTPPDVDLADALRDVHDHLAATATRVFRTAAGGS
jgi:glycerate kinase